MTNIPPPPAHNPGWFNGPTPPSPMSPPPQAAQRPGTVPLRPLSLGDFFETLFITFRHNAGPLLALGLIFGLINVVFSAAVTFGVSSLMQSFITARVASDIFGGTGVLMLVLTLSFALVGPVVQSVVSTALISAVGISTMRSTLGLKTRLGQLFRLLSGSWGQIILFVLLTLFASLVALLVAFGIPIALLIPMLSEIESGENAVGFVIGWVLLILGIFLAITVVFIWLSIKFIYAASIIGVEQIGVIGALKRSWMLTKTRWWRTFGIMLLFSMMVNIAATVVTAPVSLGLGISGTFSPGTEEDITQLNIATEVIGQSIITLTTTVMSLFTALAVSLMYFDARARAEGFHIQLTQMARYYRPETEDRFTTETGHTSQQHLDHLVPGRDAPPLR